MREQKFKEGKVLFDKSGAILLNWATGFGKTLASLMLLGENNRIVVLCQELGHIANWRRELQKHGLELNIEFQTYASMHKVEGEGYHLILDEAHWCTSDLRLEKLCALEFDKVVLLSASMESDDIDKISVCIPDLLVHNITLQDAIDGGVLPDPDIIVNELTLDTKVKQCIHYKKRGKGNYVVFNCTYGTWFKTLKEAKKHKNHIVVCACTEDQKYKMLSGEADYFKRQAFHNDRFWVLYRNKRLEMKRFLSNRKTQYAEKMMSTMAGRHIVFASSIAQARQLGDDPIHSKNPEKLNELILEEFNSKKTNCLVTVKKLRESANLVDIDTGLIVQIDNKLKSPIQMIGRVLRGKNPTIHLLCFINTLDDSYIREHLKDLKHVRTTFRH